jgi:circadian clock protein KaiB
MSRRAAKKPARAGRRPRSGAKHNYVLVLYVTGSSPLSVRAVHNLRALCDEYLAGRHCIEVVDLYRHPEKAASVNVVAAPTVIKASPLPVQRFVGDMSDKSKLVARLRLRK